MSKKLMVKLQCVNKIMKKKQISIFQNLKKINESLCKNCAVCISIKYIASLQIYVLRGILKKDRIPTADSSAILETLHILHKAIKNYSFSESVL